MNNDILREENKDCITYKLNGLLHRTDGPAAIYKKKVYHDGYKRNECGIYYEHGKQHRLNGPARTSVSDMLGTSYFVKGFGYHDFEVTRNPNVKRKVDNSIWKIIATSLNSLGDETFDNYYLNDIVIKCALKIKHITNQHKIQSPFI